MFLFNCWTTDENENENEIDDSESKQSEHNALENNSNSDDEQKRGSRDDSGNSLEIKRERNENNSTKIDGNDGETNTVNNGKSNTKFYLQFICLLRLKKMNYILLTSTWIFNKDEIDHGKKWLLLVFEKK